ncbi:nucleotide sugar dehydrogenase [Parasphingorhabdus pacifica]
MTSPERRLSVDLVVVGLGYVGLPLAVRTCAAGLTTVGLDISADVASGLNAGRSHVEDVSDTVVAGMLDSGFHASTDPSVIDRADTVVLCVPTGLTEDGEPDLTAVRDAAHTVAAHMRPKALVVLESTSYPGTTEEVVRPILEGGSGLTAGEDFHLAYSPERVDPGNKSFDVRNTPKVIGGVTPLCAKHGVAFYGHFVDTLVVSKGAREAEMAKLLENTYRYVNIGLVNEVSLFCDRMGIDVWDVLHCAGTKPFGFASFHPGPGIGGHCIPVDPLYLAHKASSEGFSFNSIAAARDINERMPEHVVARADKLVRGRGRSLSGARVLLLGVSYKRDTTDMRDSPAFPVARGLLRHGADVCYHDPGVPSFTVDETAVSKEESVTDALESADIAILMQDHSCYEAAQLVASGCPLLDTRGKLSGENVTLL